MANEIIRPSELPPRSTPVASEVVPSDDGSTVAGVSWKDGVNAGRPMASRLEAEAGVVADKAMSPLTTKQAIDAQVGPKISTAIGDLNLGSASQSNVEDFATAAQGALADTAVQPSRTVSAGAGLTGGGTLATDQTIALNPASIASLSKADTSVQTVNGESPDGAGNVVVDAEFTQEKDSRASAILATFAPAVEWVRTAGYASVGDGGGALYKRSALEPSHAGKFQSADGAWWEIAERNFLPQMFGVRAVPRGEDSLAMARLLDITTAWNAMSDAALELGASVSIPEGRYAHSGTLRWHEAVTYLGLGGQWNWRPGGITGGISTPPEIYRNARGAMFVAIDSFSKDFTADFITKSTQSGYDRPLLPEDREYNNEFDEAFELLDLTNGDAVGATRATLRPFSVAHHLIGNSMGRFVVSGVTAVSNCPDPVIEPGGFGLGGYALDTAIVPWADCDIGVFCQSPWRADISFNVFGYWNDRGWLVNPAREGSQSGGYAEHSVYHDMLVQGGIAVRSADNWPILSKTSNSITVRWTPSHRFLPSGSLRIGTSVYTQSSYAYTSLTYDDSGAFPTLTFGGMASTSSITVAGDEKDMIFFQLGAGFALTIWRDCEFYDFAHATKVDQCSPEFAPRQMKYRACIEISGDPIRAIRFENCIAHPSNGPALHIGKMWDVEYTNNYHEPRGRRVSVSGPSGSRGSVAINGPRADIRAETGLYATSTVNIHGRTFWPGISRRPKQAPSSSSYRFYNMPDLWNERETASSSRTLEAYGEIHTRSSLHVGDSLYLGQNAGYSGVSPINNDLGGTLVSQSSPDGLGIRLYGYGQLRVGSRTVAPLQLHRSNTGAIAEFRYQGELQGAIRVSAAQGMSMRWGDNGTGVLSGEGSPEGAMIAPPGSIYLRQDGTLGQLFYIKQVNTGNTGWDAVY